MFGRRHDGLDVVRRIGLCGRRRRQRKGGFRREVRNLSSGRSYADYTMYSAGMKKLGDSSLVWTEENIDKWITNPKAMIPDSTMALAFQGIPDANERADIIAYLKTFSQ